MKKYQRKNIGEVYLTNEVLGKYKATVIDGGTRKRYCTVQINDWIHEVQYIALKNGVVKYPFHPSICSVGYFGVGKYKAKINGIPTKVYDLWNSMIKRAYDYKRHDKHPTYRGVTVAKEWHDFQVFAEWVENNYVEGWNLDKDLLQQGVENKIYSSSTCVFIPYKLNSFFIKKSSRNTSGHKGVYWEKSRRKWIATINDIDNKQIRLGQFNSSKEASMIYKNARAKLAKRLRTIYKDVLPVYILNLIN